MTRVYFSPAAGAQQEPVKDAYHDQPAWARISVGKPVAGPVNTMAPTEYKLFGFLLRLQLRERGRPVDFVIDTI